MHSAGVPRRRAGAGGWRVRHGARGTGGCCCCVLRTCASANKHMRTIVYLHMWRMWMWRYGYVGVYRLSRTVVCVVMRSTCCACCMPVSGVWRWPLGAYILYTWALTGNGQVDKRDTIQNTCEKKITCTGIATPGGPQDGLSRCSWPTLHAHVTSFCKSCGQADNAQGQACR